MKSKSKKPLTLTEIQQIIESSFSTTNLGSIIELTDGRFNTAYSIELPDLGQEVVMKVAPLSEIKILTYEKNIMKTEVQVYKILKEKTEVPVPEILSYNFKHDIINRDYLIMEKLKGIPWDKIESNLSHEQNDQLKYKTGIYAAQINSVIGNHFGYFTDKKKSYNKSWKNTFVNMIKNVLDDGIELNAEIPRSSKHIMRLVENKAKLLDDVKVPQLVHWDLWEGNIFIIEQEQGYYSIEGIIDCERALWGDPLIEYEFMHAPSNQAFLKGFETETNEKFEFTDNLEQRRHLYNVYLFLIMVIEAISRGYYGSKAMKIIQWARFELQNNISQLEKKYN
ncbi:MAG: aminoglycoside phosphotransferase family protein [Candidatus Heimdallarchaeota archaeon]|nr:MAG: aminoglycoside phosphotransferase family protein [Candidatus Heimdallarchaeota archaeon]